MNTTKRLQIVNQRKLKELIDIDKDISERCNFISKRGTSAKNRKKASSSASRKSANVGDITEDFEIGEIEEIIHKMDRMIQKISKDIEFTTQSQKLATLKTQIQCMVLRRCELMAKYESCSNFGYLKDQGRYEGSDDNQKLLSLGKGDSHRLNILNKGFEETKKKKFAERILRLELNFMESASLIDLQKILKSMFVRIKISSKRYIKREISEINGMNLLENDDQITLLQRIIRRSLVLKEISKNFEHEIQLFLKSARRDKLISKRNMNNILSKDEIMQDLKVHKEMSIKALETVKAEQMKYLRQETIHNIGENLQEELYQYFIEYRSANGKFPVFPNETDGGSSKLFNNQKTIWQLKTEIEAKQNDQIVLDNLRRSSGVNKTMTQNLELLASSIKIYDDQWRDMDKKDINYHNNRINSRNNMETLQEKDSIDKYSINLEIIRTQNVKDITEEIRHQVDDEMREVLEDLRASIDQEKEPKASKGKKPKNTSKLGSNRGLSKAMIKKLKEFESLKVPSDRCFDLVSNLADEGLIMVPNDSWPSMQDLIVDKVRIENFQHCENNFLLPISVVKSYVYNQLIIPDQIINYSKDSKSKENFLDQKSIKDSNMNFEILPKSFLIAGPKGIGKRHFIQAIAKELQAIVIDLSCNKLSADRFVGKDGMKQLLHSIKKLAINLSPIIILVENVDYLFRKKAVKMHDGTDTRRLKKELPKLMKFFEKNQSVYLFGTSEAPWEADKKSMTNLFDKTFCLSNPSALQIEQLLLKTLWTKSKQKKSREKEIIKLSKACDGLNLHQIDQIMRIMRFSYQDEAIENYSSKILNHFRRRFTELVSKFKQSGTEGEMRRFNEYAMNISRKNFVE